jgi:hypothetical protein
MADSMDFGVRVSAVRVQCALIVVAILLTGTACGRSDGNKADDHSVGVAYNRLEHKIGAFALYHSVQAARYKALDLDFLLMSYQPQKEKERNSSLQSNGTQVLDAWIQQNIYSTYCPVKPTRCSTPPDDMRRALLDRIRSHVQQAKESGTVAAYYLTDDFRINLTSLLPVVRGIIRSIDPTAPTVCGVALPLTYRYVRGERAYKGLDRFREALTNYSPSWCDSVAIYSYGPTTPRPQMVQVDWTMRETLPAALRLLRSRGWRPDGGLIGVPQAFGYWPRTSIRGRALATPQYRHQPSSRALASQIDSFCRYGASTIIGYVWDDGSGGHVTNLSNSQPLRDGFTRGVQRCRSSSWQR